MGEPADLLERGGERLVGVAREVVAHQRRLLGRCADHRLLELHLDQAPLAAELDDVALDLDGHAGDELRALQHREHVVQRRRALELQRGQPRRDLVQARAELLERRQRLVGLGEHDRDVLEDVLDAVDVDRDDLTALGDRDHQRVGLLGHALGGAMAGARLVGEDRRIGHQLDVRHRDLRGVGVEDDRPVHLRHLVEEGGRVVDVELDPAGEQEAQILGLADRDQAAGAGVEDALDALTERRPGRDHLQRPHQSRIRPYCIVYIFAGPRCHNP